MSNNEENQTDKALDRMAIYDFIFIVPMFLLFSFLPTYGFWSIILNVVIVILVGFGLSYITHTLIDVYKKRKQKNNS